MARNSETTFELREIAAALFRFQGIHEGRWQLALDVSVSNAHVGPDDQGPLPGVLIVMRGLRLRRDDQAPDGSPQVFDAAKENPRE